MQIPATMMSDAMRAIPYLQKAVGQGGVAQKTLELVHMRASQINGCSACIELGIAAAGKSGESLDRMVRLAGWREADGFTDAERAALALTEAATRLADRPDAVTDEIWAEAARHYDENGLAALILMIGMTNFFNRINTTIRLNPTRAMAQAAAGAAA